METTKFTRLRSKLDSGGQKFLRGKGDENCDIGSRAKLLDGSKKLGMGLHCYKKALMGEGYQTVFEATGF